MSFEVQSLLWLLFRHNSESPHSGQLFLLETHSTLFVVPKLIGKYWFFPDEQCMAVFDDDSPTTNDM